ncbi:MAG TPA: hypothetical protein VEU50_46480 [Archangium sp.]|nr:hypothetical protein [Archangium sp.]
MLGLAVRGVDGGAIGALGLAHLDDEARPLVEELDQALIDGIDIPAQFLEPGRVPGPCGQWRVRRGHGRRDAVSSVDGLPFFPAFLVAMISSTVGPGE